MLFVFMPISCFKSCLSVLCFMFGLSVSWSAAFPGVFISFSYSQRIIYLRCIVKIISGLSTASIQPFLETEKTNSLFLPSWNWLQICPPGISLNCTSRLDFAFWNCFLSPFFVVMLIFLECLFKLFLQGGRMGGNFLSSWLVKCLYFCPHTWLIVWWIKNFTFKSVSL